MTGPNKKTLFYLALVALAKLSSAMADKVDSGVVISSAELNRLDHAMDEVENQSRVFRSLGKGKKRNPPQAKISDQTLSQGGCMAINAASLKAAPGSQAPHGMGVISLPGCSTIYILKSFQDLQLFNSKIKDTRVYSSALSDPATTGQIIVLTPSGAYSTHRFDINQSLQFSNAKTTTGSAYTLSQGLFRITATSPDKSVVVPATLSPHVTSCPVTAADLAPGASTEVIGDANKVTLMSFVDAKPKASGRLRL